MISRILDLMYIQMLRLWATSAVSSPGWLGAGMDPDIGGVLDAIHADPARAWCSPDTTAARPGQWRHDHITS
jgi:hypothetical protein